LATPRHDTPLLSVVVAARNDDHGKNMLHRMQIFVTGFLEQARRHTLASELIIVEWNPPAGRPRLIDALFWEGADGPCRVRIIEVPPAVHRRYPHADRLPLFQMIAKNVGIRRARGRFVLCTNIDLLFSDALIELCASGRLDPRCLYRVDRLDVSADVPVGVPVTEQLEFCRRNVLRANTRWGTFERGQIPTLVLISRLWQRFEGARLWAAMRVRLARSAELAARLAGILREWLVRPRRVSRDGLGRLLRGGGRLVRRLGRGTRATLRRVAYLPWALARSVTNLSSALAGLYRDTLRPLHTNACGDFTLLAREQWCALRGYPELPMFSLHLDSVFCQMAHHSGVREAMLGRRCHAYHMDHESGWSPQEAIRLVRRMEDLRVPVVDRELYSAWVATMRRQGGTIIFNGEDWGLDKENLTEIEPGAVRNVEWVQAAPQQTTIPG
jgi:hypothetical protein